MNAQGMTEADAKRNVAAMEQRLGPDLWNKLQTAARNFHDVQSPTTEVTGLDLFKPSLWKSKIEPNLGNYVPRAVLEYFSGNITAQIKQRYGSFKLTLAPDQAAQMKMQALMGRMAHQRKVTTMVRFFSGVL